MATHEMGFARQVAAPGLLPRRRAGARVRPAGPGARRPGAGAHPAVPRPSGGRGPAHLIGSPAEPVGGDQQGRVTGALVLARGGLGQLDHVFVTVLDGPRGEPLAAAARGRGRRPQRLGRVPRRGEGGHDRRRRPPAGGHAGPLQVGRAARAAPAAGPPGAVTAWQNAIGASSRAASTRAAAPISSSRAPSGIVGAGPPPVEAAGRPWQPGQRAQPAADAGPLGRHGRGRAGAAAAVASRRRAGRSAAAPGNGLVAGRPEPEALGQLVDQQRIGVGAGGPQRTDRVRGADHPVRGAGGQPGEQPRPPAQQQLAPVALAASRRR